MIFPGLRSRQRSARRRETAKRSRTITSCGLNSGGRGEIATDRKMAELLGGEVRGGQVRAPGPGHSAGDRSLSVMLDASAPDGFVVNSFAGDDAHRVP